jgi:CheY-like chemotaxis protein
VALVLIVDDEVEVARSIGRVLRRDGFDVRTARSGVEALEMLDGVDILLTDVRMPGMSGLELVAEVKRAHPAIRCCVMSGDAGAEGVAAAAPMVEGYLGKPFSHEKLLALVRGARAPPPAAGER